MDDFISNIFGDIQDIPDFLFSLITKFFVFVKDVFFNFLDFSSSSFLEFGSSIYDFISSKIVFGDFNFILIFLGLSVSIFLFKLLWQLITSFF